MADRKDIEKLVRELQAMGWRVDTDRKHYVAYPPDKTKRIVTFAKTPSDGRAWKNIIAELRRSGAEL